jgi:hypothetical protein
MTELRRRIVDLQGAVKRRFSVYVHPSTVGTWLHPPDPAAAAAGASEERPCSRDGF